MKKEVMLQFPSLRAVYLFCAAIRLDIFEMNVRNCTLICTCHEEDMSLAVIRYGAKLVHEKGTPTSRVRPGNDLPSSANPG